MCRTATKLLHRLLALKTYGCGRHVNRILDSLSEPLMHKMLSYRVRHARGLSPASQTASQPQPATASTAIQLGPSQWIPHQISSRLVVKDPKLTHLDTFRTRFGFQLGFWYVPEPDKDGQELYRISLVVKCLDPAWQVPLLIQGAQIISYYASKCVDKQRCLFGCWGRETLSLTHTHTHIFFTHPPASSEA